MAIEMEDWVAENREEITRAVGRVLGHVPETASCYCPKSGTTHDHDTPPLDDDELAEWVANDEGLYNWAQSDGVDV